MYGLAECALCRRPRIIDGSNKESSCPFCGYTENQRKMRVVFASEDQATVRRALGLAMGYIPPDEKAKKRRIEETDPYSTMVFKFEHTSDLEEKLEILAKGLTECKGTFTEDDVEEIVGKNAGRYIGAMMERCLIAEVRPGIYKGRFAGRSSSSLPSSAPRG